MTTLARTTTYTRAFDASAIGAILVGGIGALFGLGGLFAVVLGDDMIPMELGAVTAGLLAAVALLAVAFVRDHPDIAALGIVAAPVGYLVAFGGSWSAWWDRYQTAIATSGAAENTFWAAEPAMALFAISGVLLVIAALLAAYDAFFTTTE